MKPHVADPPLVGLAGSTMWLQHQSFIFPGTADEAAHLERSVVGPQDAQYLGTAPDLEPVREIWPGMLPFEGVPVSPARTPARGTNR